jgi:hypothetical protein
MPFQKMQTYEMDDSMIGINYSHRYYVLDV